MYPTFDPTQVRECQVVRKHLGERSMLSCRYDPSGRFLAAGGMMPDVAQYELASTGESIDWTKLGRIFHLPGHKTWVAALTFSPDGQHLFTADYSGLLHSWDFPVREGPPAPAWAIQAHQGWVRAVAVSPDGRLLATCGNDHAVRLWSTADGRLVHELSGHDCHVYNLAFHPSGNRLVSGDLKGQLKDWEVTTGRLVREISAKEMWAKQANLQLGGIRCMAFHPDGRTLACGGMYGFGSIGDGIGSPCLLLFDWESGKRIRLLQAKDAHRAFVNGIHFHPSGLILAVTGGLDGGVILFWKPNEEKAFHQHKLPQSGWSSDLHRDGAHLAIAHHDLCLRIFDLAPAPAKK